MAKGEHVRRKVRKEREESSEKQRVKEGRDVFPLFLFPPVSP